MLRRLSVIAALLLLSPILANGIHAYGCIQRITADEVLFEARKAYLDRLIATKSASASDLAFIKCGVPDETPAYLYGVRLGTEWRMFCAYIKDETVLTSQHFSINRCKATRNWEYVDEGFPKPVQTVGYDQLL